jgi:hypothetical protein
MAKSMSERQLKEFAGTKRKKLPTKKKAGKKSTTKRKSTSGRR